MAFFLECWYHINIFWWQIGFLIHFCFSVTITVFMFDTVYFWVSIGFFAFLYLLAVLVIWIVYFMLPDDKPFYPLQAFLLPWLPFDCQATESIQIDRNNKSCGPIFCYIIIAIPILLYMLFSPFYVFFAAFYTVYIEKWDFDWEVMNYLNIMMIPYLLPQNIIHLVILLNYDIDNIILYLLLVICILIAILWYTATLYLFFHHSKNKIVPDPEDYDWSSDSINWSSAIIELLLILFFIFNHVYIGNNAILPYLSIIFYILCIPLSMPIICLIWSAASNMINSSNGSFFEELIDSAESKDMFYDKLYAALHAIHHEPLDYVAINENESVGLLEHVDRLMLCVKYQYDYFKLDTSSKRKYIQNNLECNSIWKRMKIYCKLNTMSRINVFIVISVIYCISRVYMMLLPFYWFFGVYLYDLNGGIFCNDDNIDCVENIFMSILSGFYAIFVMIMITAMVKLLKCEYYFGYIDSFITDEVYIKQQMTELVECMKRNKALFDAIDIEENIGLIICSFLTICKTCKFTA